MATTLEMLLDQAMDSQARDLWTSLPARVLAFDAGDTPTVSVQPFPATYLDGEATDLPALGAVPVCYPGGAGGGMVYPLTPGDVVLLVFSTLPLGNWRNSGSEGDPREIRHHDLSDAFAIPLRCAGAGPTVTPDRLLVEQPDAGKVQIGSAFLHPAAARVGDTVSVPMNTVTVGQIISAIAQIGATGACTPFTWSAQITSGSSIVEVA